jgi:hypothetical protein
LQFKKNALHILNVTKEDVFLESENKYKGISNPGAACETDYGCAWANETGCYLYDGEKVTNLLEKGGQRKIKSSTWSSHIGTLTAVGYNPIDRQIVVTADNGNGYLYDMTTGSWTFVTAIIADADSKSNFSNIPGTGVLATLNVGTPAINSWQAPSGTKTIDIQTKAFDFGEPSVRKKIYKVYISYLGGTDQDCDVTFKTDQDTSWQAMDEDLDYQTNGTTMQQAEIKPSTATAKNAKTFQLRISGTAATTFEIQDINIVYRIKGIR